MIIETSYFFAQKIETFTGGAYENMIRWKI